MDRDELTNEGAYDRLRLRQWLRGEARSDGLSRRDMLRVAAGVGLPLMASPVLSATAASAAPAGPASTAAGPVLKPLPPELFQVHGTNAETRWDALHGQGYLVPIDRFFVRNHTQTPVLDPVTWRLRLYGTGLAGTPTAENPVEFDLRQLRALPARTLTAFVECAGNGRSFFTSQQGQQVSGTAWKLGAVGVARWRGVPLSTVLRLAGLTRAAVDVMPQGLDPDFVSGGVNLGPVRRPLPVAKALRDVLLAYEMNGEPLPPDHGAPVRLVVPSWIGISSIKWVGPIEVSASPLFSPWNTQFYRLIGPDYPAEGTLVGAQVVKSAFELAWDASLAAGRRHVLRGRSWSANGPVRHVEVSTDGSSWRRARLVGRTVDQGWQQWEISWKPPASGTYALRARATDVTGATQPDTVPHNTQGYLFGAVVRHPVTVA
ncbi:sulfite oxidase [Plantactinospora endophytica]|uniref:Sulfite oxidase n=1 Tax=Plantactinospora endophytica TaxID=673535 RepID=A0ABQ4E105_9ACTN|nr:sulfite oxidase [Plantactinospora endophytica]GIG88347.1 sulfite oxidase [Plantactinospora endophytica]